MIFNANYSIGQIDMDIEIFSVVELFAGFLIEIFMKIQSNAFLVRIELNVFNFA